MSAGKRLVAHAISPLHPNANKFISLLPLFPYGNSTTQTMSLRGTRIMAEVIGCSPTYFHYRRRMMSSLVHSNPDEAHEDSSSPAMEVFSALDHGCMDYAKSWAWQHTLLSRRLALRRTMNSSSSSETSVEMNDPDCVLLLEHAPVYTLGRGSDESHLTFLSSSDDTAIQERLSRRARGPGTARLTVDRQVDEVVGNLPLPQAIDHLSKLATPVLAPNGVPIYRVERGGEVTWHGPSQLVVYPLFDLKRSPFQQDLHWYLTMVEEVVIQTLHHYNIEGYRDEENTGVWVNEEKVAAVGISSSRWITTHGFALNVNPNLDYFDTSIILPCGIEGKGVTSMAKVLQERGGKEEIPTMSEVANVVLESIQSVFGVSNFRKCESPNFVASTME